MQTVSVSISEVKLNKCIYILDCIVFIGLETGWLDFFSIEIFHKPKRPPQALAASADQPGAQLKSVQGGGPGPLIASVIERSPTRCADLGWRVSHVMAAVQYAGVIRLRAAARMCSSHKLCVHLTLPGILNQANRIRL